MSEVVWLGAGWEADVDASVVGWFDGEEAPVGAEGELRALAVAARDVGLASTAAGRVSVLPTYGRSGPSRLVVVGLGPRERYDAWAARLAAAAAARQARQSGARRLAMALHLAHGPLLDQERAAEAVVLGARRGLWRYDGYRTTAPREAQVQSVGLTPAAAAGVRESVRRAGVIADSVALAREIDVLGSNDKYPSRVAERAQAYAAQVGLDVQVLDERDLADMGAGLILGVGQGSVHPPRMVVLRTPTGAAPSAGGPLLALVGKGITFDSGGISLKPGAGMGDMKYDLCGAVAVMAALGALARLGSPLPVIGILCLAENLPGGSAQRPGDVVKSLDGQTVEVDNTDAEGRLVMADGLALARRLGATHLVDVATLTGACVTALGHAYSGLMGNDKGLMAALEDAAARACERVWPLPLDHTMYDRAIRSDVADMRNTGGRAAGAITAAAFLRRFAHETPWAHLDIAGTAWLTEGDSARTECIDRGPTGVMVETFVHLPERLAAAP